jgi:hypothetical protein
MPIELEFLPNRWIHAHEEDTPLKLVYRPSTFPLGLSRNRDILEFFADGRVLHEGIGYQDGKSFVQAKWTVKEDGRTICIKEENQEITLEIITLVADKMVLSK